MVGRDRRELKNRLRVILLHLLKWQAQPALAWASWRKSLRTQRRAYPGSASAEPEPAAAGAGTRARSVSGCGQGCGRRDRPAADRFPVDCPYAPDEVLAEDYLPDAKFDF